MRIDGLLVATHPDVYRPSDDTFLLADAVRQVAAPGRRCIEVGCGAGLVSLVAARVGADVVATDRNPAATRLTAANARANGIHVQVVCTDLLTGLRGGDVVAFNPPYLPTAPDETLEDAINLAFDGGPDGNTTVLRFADQVARLSVRPAVVLVVHSSLSDPGPLDAAMAAAGFGVHVAATRRLSWEELAVRRYEPRGVPPAGSSAPGGMPA